MVLHAIILCAIITPMSNVPSGSCLPSTVQSNPSLLPSTSLHVVCYLYAVQVLRAPLVSIGSGLSISSFV